MGCITDSTYYKSTASSANNQRHRKIIAKIITDTIMKKQESPTVAFENLFYPCSIIIDIAIYSSSLTSKQYNRDDQVKKPESPTVAFENPFYASSSREQGGNTTVRFKLTMMWMMMTMMMMLMMTMDCDYDDYDYDDY